MPYRTIVVGTDGSPTASVAVEVAQKLAKRLRGTAGPRRGARRVRRVPAAAADGALRGRGARASEEGRRHRRADRRHAGGVDPRRRDQARRRPDRGREPWDGAGDPLPAGERSGLGRARRAVRPPHRGHDRSRRPPRTRASLLEDPGGDGRVRDGDRGRAQGVHARLRLRRLGDPRARGRSARRRDQARGGHVAETGGRGGPEADRRRRPRPADLRARRSRRRPTRRGRQQGDGRGPAVPRLGAEQGRARGALGRPDREDGGPLGRRSRRRPRRPGERGRTAAGRLPRRRGQHVRALATLHPHGLHGRLERQREDLGLPVSRVAVRRRRIRRARARVGAARTDRRVGDAGRRRGSRRVRRRAALVTRIGARRPRRGAAGS